MIRLFERDGLGGRSVLCDSEELLYLRSNHNKQGR